MWRRRDKFMHGWWGRGKGRPREVGWELYGREGDDKKRKEVSEEGSGAGKLLLRNRLVVGILFASYI